MLCILLHSNVNFIFVSWSPGSEEKKQKKRHLFIVNSSFTGQNSEQLCIQIVWRLLVSLVLLHCDWMEMAVDSRKDNNNTGMGT